MATEDDLRRVALALPEVTERTSYGTVAFAVAGNVFVRVHEQPGVVVLWQPSLEARQELLDSEPDSFFTTDHYAGHASVLLRLDTVDVDELAELLADAWAARAPKRLL